LDRAIVSTVVALPGVSVLVYDQTCAAEKRRRRKRSLFPDPDKRAFIIYAELEGKRTGDAISFNGTGLVIEEVA